MKLSSSDAEVVIRWIHPQSTGGKDVEDSKVAVLLEDLRAQFQVFGEGLEAVQQEIKQESFELRGQIGRLEQKLDAEIEQNHKEHKLMMQMLEQNHEEHRLMMQMTRDLRYDFQVELKHVR